MTKHSLSRLLLCLGLLAPLAYVAPLYAENPAAPDAAATEATKFLRFVDNGRAGGKLETGVVTYRNKEGVTVTLVAAIHIGEKSYFEGLNKLFIGYDAVLYELVKPKDAHLTAPGTKREEKPAENSGINLIHDMQHFMKDTLNLEYQLDVIDYTKQNFIHADLDRETFERMQAQRGESFEMLMLQQMMSAMSRGDAGPAADNGPDLRDVLRMLTRPDGERQIKLIVAKQLADMGSGANGFGGMGGTVILAERNKACTKVLQRVLEGGRKNVAIFYGAAHMPDLEDRLSLMGFKQVSSEYRKAWDLTIRADQPSAAEKIINGLLDGLGDDKDEK